jgi:SHS2 domain-containing protein
MDASRHRFGTIVKAATMHRLVVAEREGRHEVRVIVDV